MPEPSTQLVLALDHHRAGRLPQARTLYEAVLQVDPTQPDALHLLGVLEHQLGNHREAIERIRQALTLAPDSAVYYGNLGNALRADGQVEAAVEAYQRALKLNPADADACNNLGNVCQRSGRLDDAERLYQRALQIQPQNPSAHNNLGTVYRTQQRLDEAIGQFLAALQIRPDYLDALVNLAHVLAQTRRFQEASTVYQHALALSPDSAELRCAWSTVLTELDDWEEAERVLRAAIELEPDCAEAYDQLGSLLRRQQRVELAIEAYQAALRIKPDFAAARSNLGNALMDQHRLDDAAEQYVAALQRDPKLADAHYNLALVLLEKHELPLAEAALRRALELNPRFGAAFKALAHLLDGVGRTSEAHAVYRQWHAIDPEHPIAAHLAASLGDQPPPPRASDEFIRAEFNEFASQFDQKLQRLQYRGPELVGRQLEREGPEPGRRLDVLDAGCGTGLCGHVLRPQAARLVGVDLSPDMLRQARKRKLYDELVAEELTTYFTAHPAEFDLIVACDTLNYFGDLRTVAQAARQCLRAGGRFLFTVERIDEESPDASFRLRPHGRYCHTETYLRQVLTGAGFEVSRADREVLRTEASTPVEGLVVMAVVSD